LTRGLIDFPGISSGCLPLSGASMRCFLSSVASEPKIVMTVQFGVSR
jgi:hypothetical protein